MKALLILGNQLFPISYYESFKHCPYFMAEAYELAQHFKYHRQKLVFFFSSMRHYHEILISHGFKGTYSTLEPIGFFERLQRFIKKNQIRELISYEIEDHFFETEVQSFCVSNDIKLTFLQTPMFLNSRQYFEEYLRSTKKPFMKTFYERQRRERSLLMTKGQPQGGRFSFDTENRLKLPSSVDIPPQKIHSPDVITRDVMKLVLEKFPDHPGDLSHFWLPVTPEEALSWLDDFIEYKLTYFGPYEDALSPRDPFLFHSVLSPAMNIGFLPPELILERVLKKYKKIPLASLEGFIRQIIGWREFVRGIYHHYDQQQQKLNFFDHQNKLSPSWYSGETSIPVLTDCLKKVVHYGYNHHIERLMVIGNLMLLLEVHPQEVYRWFMEMYVDSSDWVMGPNVFGMSQFSDGGIFATKPYICGSNYWLKMSSYKKDRWCDGVDGLYWQFIEKHQSYFEKNPRLFPMTGLLKKMDRAKKRTIFKAADNLRQELTF